MLNRQDQSNSNKMLAGNSFHEDQQPADDKSDNRLSNHCHGDDNNTNAAQRSPSVFLAKVTVPQQNPKQSLEEQPSETGDIKENGVDHPEPATNGSNGDNDDDNDDVSLLYVEQNDVISIEQPSSGDEKWFLARSDQQVGRILRTSCSILDDRIPTNLCRYLIDNCYFNLNVCFASFVAQDVGDLSVTKGDIIVAIVAVNEHWMQGQVCFDSQADRWPKLAAGKQVGTFPLNHCWQLDLERVKAFCQAKIEREKSQNNIRSSTLSSNMSQQIPGWSFPAQQPPTVNSAIGAKKPFLSIAHSSSLSSGSSSLYSSDYNQATNRNEIKQQNHQPSQQNDYGAFQKMDRVDSNHSVPAQPPPRPAQLPRQMSERQKSSSERAVSKPSSILTNRQQDKLKGWLHTVKKKTARLSTRITASLGLISLTRDEEFERHYESFKQLEKSIRVFIKNLTQFVEHFENFLVALQSTSDNLADFYRDKSYQKEINEMRKKNKALNCEHFHAFKRTVDRQVIAVASQLLQKFSAPHQLVHKRSAKLLDFDTKTKEMDSCRDPDKRAKVREDYVIAKDLYDRINGQLIEELPLFNQFAMDIFRECILVLLESRRNLMLAYTQKTANLLDTPLMASYTASGVANSILMSCELAPHSPPPPPPPPPSTAINSKIQSECKQSCSDTRSVSVSQEFKVGCPPSDNGAQPSGSSGTGTDLPEEITRPRSAMSQLSSEFGQMALAAREISSTPLSQISDTNNQNNTTSGDLSVTEHHIANNVRFDEPDTKNHRYDVNSDVSSDNRHNENIESTIQASNVAGNRLGSAALNGDRINKARKRRSRHPIFIASWPFVASGPNQLSIACNQPLKLVKGCDECGNSDWSLVKDKKGNFGYVPSSYIKPKD